MAKTRKIGHCRCRYNSVEFIGGPFDGHRESVPHDLSEDLACPVSDNVFRLLGGNSHGPKRPITSVALYERQKRDGHWCYCFMGSVRPTQWLVEHLNDVKQRHRA